MAAPSGHTAACAVLAPVTAQRGPAGLAFGKVATGTSRSARGAPYTASSELAEAAASVQAAEQLLASSPEPLDALPGGVAVKVEGASA